MTIRSALTPILLLAAGALAAPRTLSAQADGGLARARAALSATAGAELATAVDQARGEGLPTEPLVDKALEGIAKHVPPERIIAVVRSLHTQLMEARAVLATNAATPPQPDAIAGVADALRRGVPEAALRDLASAGDGAGIAIESHVLADLLERGVPVKDAVDVLAAWRARGRDPGQLRNLPAAVENLMRGGKGPAEAAADVAATVRAGHVLLGPGGVPAMLGGPPGLVKKGLPPIPPGLGPPTDSKGHGKKKGGGSQG